MTRWLSGIVLVCTAALSNSGLAQEHWPQSGFQNTGYIGDNNPSRSVFGAWGHGSHTGVSPAAHAQLIPDDRGWGYGPDYGLQGLARQASHGSWVRFDFLHWDIKGPDSTLLGAPVAPDTDTTPFDLTGQDRLRRLPAQDRVQGARPQTFAVIPRIGEAEESALNGFRASFGIPTTVGDFEASGFVLEEHDDRVKIDPFADSFNFQTVTLIGAVSLLNDGVVTNDTMILFSEGLIADLTTNVYGLEANWVQNPLHPNTGIQVRPIFGLRYLYLEEQLRITGTDIPDPVNDPMTILNHRINSLSQNHIFGPQVGFRAEGRRNRFSLGTEFKFLFGMNRLEDQVETAQIFTMTEDPQIDGDENTRFAPIVDFSVYGKFHATDHINFLVEYQLIAGGGFSRAYDTIDYNTSASVNDPPEIDTRNELSNFYAHGLVLGVEIIFP